VNLLIDIGNSLTKLAFADQGQLSEIHTLENADTNRIKRLIYDIDFEALIYSSSGKISSDLIDFFDKKIKYVLEFSHFTRIPIKNNYETPLTLGKDRLAAAIGANSLFPGEDILVIDFGTAITYEYISDSTYLGGNISPGMQTRFFSLHEHTARLPLLSAEKTFSEPGKSTQDAMQAGVIKGILYEAEAYIRSFSQAYPDGKVLFTGGDSIFFAELIKTPIFVQSHLVLFGLNTILDYNK
jgi:type III pantothenate kinase